MIVCWVLFSIAAVTSVASFIAYSDELSSLPVAHSEDSSIDPEVLADLQEQFRLRHLSKSTLGQTAYMTRALAIGILLWNILCHTAQWIWRGRKVQ